MPKSLITKKMIAKSLKKLMRVADFEKITTADIMHEAAIRRQTFYDHFHDKYDLLTWIFETELNEHIQDNIDYYHWRTIIRILLTYLDDNHVFYKKAFAIIGQNAFDDFFTVQCQLLLRNIFTDSADDFTLHYHANALSKLIKDTCLHSKTALIDYYEPLCQLLENQI